MKNNIILIMIIGLFSNLCYAMQQQNLFPNLSQPRTQFQQDPMQRTNVTLANIDQMHGKPVSQDVLNKLKGVDAIIASRHNANLAQQRQLK